MKKLDHKIHVAHILLRHAYEAEDILRKLKSGSVFEDLAMKHSECSSAKVGGDLGEIRKSRLDSDFVEAAEGLKNPGDFCGPVRTRFGFHIIKRLK